jgi:hypothetical protein
MSLKPKFTGYFVPDRDSNLRATLSGLLFTCVVDVEDGKARGYRLIPRRVQIALALAQIGKFLAMTYGFSTAYPRGPEPFSEENLYD